MFQSFVRIAMCAVVLGISASANAGEALLLEAAPAWVQDIPIPQHKASADDSSVRTLLLDSQVRYGDKGQEQYYYHSAVEVLNAQGLDEAGTVSESWDPLTETLAVHRVEIIRDGKTIDALAEGEPFTVIRRERNLSYAMLDGRLTATRQLEGLMVGDIVRTTMTLTSNDPTLQGRAEYWNTLSHSGVVARVRYRQIWGKGRELRWLVTEGMPKPTIQQTALGTELIIDARDVRTPIAPEGAPGRFNTLGEIELTEFKSWQELSALFAPYYAEAATLKEGSAIRAEAAKIRDANSGKLGQASAALQLVQQRIRYVALTMGEAGYRPAASDLTWSRRFGDCKGKSALLIAILKELGIAAEAVIVNTSGGDGLEKRLPRASLFDHVIVRVEIDGKVYWVDPTRSGDKRVERAPMPSYGWALPLRAGGATLEALKLESPSEPVASSVFELDMTAGLGVDSLVTLSSTYRGEMAHSYIQGLAAISRADAERSLREKWGAAIPWMKIDKVSLLEENEDGSVKVWLTGKGAPPWKMVSGTRFQELNIGDSTFNMSFDKRPADALPQDAPFELVFPYFTRNTVILRLPKGGAGFDLVGADVEKTAASTAIRRVSTLKDGVATMTMDTRTVAAETPYKEALDANEVFKALPTSKQVVLRAPRDTVTTEAEATAVIQQRPKDASAYINRGQASLDYDRPTAALKDADQALALEPENTRAASLRSSVLMDLGDWPAVMAAADADIAKNPQSPFGYVRRAFNFQEQENYAKAIADLDQAIALAPTTPDLRSIRAGMRWTAGDTEGAQADIDEALRLAPDNTSFARSKIRFAYKPGAPLDPWRRDIMALLDHLIADKPDAAALYLERARYHTSSRRLDLARADYDKAVALKPSSSSHVSRAAFLASRREYDAAARDYDEAIRLDQGSDSYFNRAQLWTRKRDWERTLKDLEEALRLAPESAQIKASIARVKLEQGDTRGALSIADAIAQEDTASFERAYTRANIYLTAKQYDRAIAQYQLLERRPGNLPRQMRTLKLSLASAYGDSGKPAAADQIYTDLIAADRGDGKSMLLNNRCWLRGTRNHLADLAIQDCEASLALSSPVDQGPALDSLGLAHLRLGQYGAAIEAYDRVLAIRDDYPSAFYGRGLAKRRNGDIAGGDKDLATARELNPKVIEQFTGYGLTP